MKMAKFDIYTRLMNVYARFEKKRKNTAKNVGLNATLEKDETERSRDRAREKLRLIIISLKFMKFF